MAWFAGVPYEVAIVGKECNVKRKELDKHYVPNVIVLGGINEGTLQLLENKLIEGQTTIYVCRNKVCSCPVTKMQEALKQILK